MKDQDAPPLTGPSEFAKSITVSVSPDVLSQDGASQSLITVRAAGPNGEPLRNESMRVEILVDNTPVDYGLLSARNIVTGSDGRATAVYTAPAAPSVAVDSFTVVDIVVTPTGSDFNNSSTRRAAIRLVPPGFVVLADGLRPHFTFTPASPLESQEVLFQACNNPDLPPCAPANNPIVSYSWNFGDGSHGSGPTESHAFEAAGSYAVTLTVTDQYGRSASASNLITVGAGANPTALFVFSPTAPRVNQNIAFNASGSTAPAGRQIVGYVWDFGAGAGPVAGSVTMNRTYSVAGSYNVTLVVTDNTGKTATITVPVTITP
jgi:chitodextrinase